MAKSAVFGLASGLAVVILTLIVVAVVNLPQASGAVSATRSSEARCGLADVTQDQGYGISRTVKREVCEALSTE